MVDGMMMETYMNNLKPEHLRDFVAIGSPFHKSQHLLNLYGSGVDQLAVCWHTQLLMQHRDFRLERF